MKFKISPLRKAHATAASLLVQESFSALAALDWSDRAQAEFLAATAPESLAKKLDEMVYSAGAFHENEILGFVPLSSEFERDGRRAIRMACWLPARALDADFRVTHIQVDGKRAGTNV